MSLCMEPARFDEQSLVLTAWQKGPGVIDGFLLANLRVSEVTVW